jgi:hypothetical protein
MAKMQTLKTPLETMEYDVEKEFKKALEHLTLKPVTVKVAEDYHTKTVSLTIGGEPSLTLSRQQALDLARELRKAANRLGTEVYGQKK